MRAVAVNIESEFRSTPTGHHFTGYAAAFDSPSAPMGRSGLIEVVRPTAFARTLGVPARKTFVVDHDERRLLASTSSGHLNLTTDTRGLLTDAELPDTQAARDARELHERGETSGMSFEFTPSRGGAVTSDDGKLRELRDVRLFHVTILQGLNPAYPATTAEIRSLAEAVDADAEDVAAVIDAITEQRRLTPGEWTLAERLFAAVKPEESAVRSTPAPVSLPNLSAARELLGAR